MYRLAALVIVCAGFAACQSNIVTLFPAGLEPFSDDAMAGAIHAPVAEALVMTSATGSETAVYGDGYVFAPVANVWAAAQNPQALIATCSTNDQMITQHDETGYELDFLVSYTVNNILTVQWDDQWRGDVIATGIGSAQMDGSDGIATRAMIKHQKVDGSSFISVSEGTSQLIANVDDTMTELQFVEHLKAAEQPVDQVETGMQHEFDSLLAITHGSGVPPCPASSAN
jgi:hypothetical protein